MQNEDHGTAALNQLLTHLRNSAECRWVSVTSANIAYGSEVVDRVLQSQNVPGTNVQPDILLAPMDSKHFAKQGKAWFFLVFFSLTDITFLIH